MQRRGITVKTMDKAMASLGFSKNGNRYEKAGMIFLEPLLKAQSFAKDVELINYIYDNSSPFSVEQESNQHIFLHESLVDVQTPVIYRIDNNGKRFYYEKDENGRATIYASGTTLIADGYVDDTSYLEDWERSEIAKGNNPKEYTRYRATFGTIMHILYGDIILQKGVPTGLSHLRKYIESNIDLTNVNKEHIVRLFRNDMMEMSKDMGCFHKCLIDYNVEPFFIEKMLRSKKYGVATAVDFGCEMDSHEREQIPEYYVRGEKAGQIKGYKKGESKKRVKAIWDFKSGKNFYNTHILQLEMNRRIVKENYGKAFEVDEIYNFAPTAFRGSEIKYKLIRQTDKEGIIALADCVFEQGRLKHKYKKPYAEGFKNVELSLGKAVDYSKIYLEKPLEELLSA